MTTANRTLERVAAVLDAYQQVRKTLSGITQINWLPSVRDMQRQLDGLVYRGFLADTPWERLEHYPRYLKAIALRAEKLPHAASRDQARMQEMKRDLDQWQERYEAALQKAEVDPRLEELRWLFEELRVSFFAQELGTTCPVSLKRIRRRSQELGF